MVYGLMNLAAFLAGLVLLSFAFGWQVGVGVAMLVYFLKQAE